MTETYDEALILGYVEGDLTTEQKRAFEAQLLKDARLRNLVAQLIQDRNHLRQMAVEQAPPQIMTAVNEQLERDMLLHGDVRHPVAASPVPARQSQTRPTRDAMEQFQLSRWMGYSAIAAVLLLVVGLITYMVQDPGLDDRFSRQPALETADARSSGAAAAEAKDDATKSLSASEPLLAMGAATEAESPGPASSPAVASAPLDGVDVFADASVARTAVAPQAAPVTEVTPSPPAAPVAAATPVPTLALSSPQEGAAADSDIGSSGGVSTPAGLAMRAARAGAMSRSAPAANAAPSAASAPVQVADSGNRRESASMAEGNALLAPAAKAQSPSLPPIELQTQTLRKQSDDLGVRQTRPATNDVVIEITAAEPERSLQQVVDWASVNQIAAPIADRDGNAGRERTGIGAGLGKDQQQSVVQTMLRADGARQIEMSIAAQQVPVLLSHLNRQEGQQVRLQRVEREGPALTASQREWRSLLSQVAPLEPVIPLLSPDAPTRVSVIIRPEHHAQDEVGR